ncbi:MAG: alanine racemase [Candidatus Omnitrophota bacterium]|nr:alanine racemase [Candidatus Omnitrophota bacterium]
MFYRPTWVEVNLGNIAYNINSIRRLISPYTEILATVKADAYGHGIIPVSKKLVSLGINYLGVATLDEAIVLRNAGIKCRILILGGIFPKDADAVIRYNLTQSVFTKDVAYALNLAAEKNKKKVPIHIKVDTGMGRLGVWHSDVFSFVSQIKRFKSLDIEGIFTHLSSADVDENFSKRQISDFKVLLARLEKSGIFIPLRHVANSLGILKFKDSHFNLVRPGIIIYGLYPKDNLNIKLKSAMSLKTKIVYLKKLPKGRSVSYGHTYIADKSTIIATLPIGYGDGYPRLLSNRAPVLVKGRRAKVAGRVCMDQVMVDVGHIKNIKVGDTVILIGKKGGCAVTAEELAGLSGTICYEIVCGIGSRVPRVYI